MKKRLCLAALLSLIICSVCMAALADGYLSTDAAYVSSFEIVERKTGIGVFDADDQPGNDSSADNGIVRTFDTVSYTLEYAISTYGKGESYQNARIAFAFKLPCSSSEAAFLPGSMTWIDNADGYEYSIEEKNGEQILYCYRYLAPVSSGGSVIPGGGKVTVVFDVKQMKNGQTIQPEFYAWMEHNDVLDEEGKMDPSSVCDAHQQAEVRKITDEPITVSAKMKLNAEISSYGSRQYTTYDFDTGNQSPSPSPAAHYGLGQVTGTATYMGVNVAMYNDSPAKGLMGLEFPDVGEPITFDIHLNTYYRVDKTDYPIKGTTADGMAYDYSPLLYSYGLFTRGSSTRQDGRTNAYRDSSNQVEGLRTEGKEAYACYNGGTWKIIPEGNVLHVTISDYQINGIFPTHADPNKTSRIADNVAYISSGALTLLFPHYNVQAGGTNGDNADSYIAAVLGDGTFVNTISEGKLSAVSAGGSRMPAPTDSAPGVNNQMVTTDDFRSLSFNLSTPGSYSVANQFQTRPGGDQNHPWTTNCFTDGRDWAFPGSKVAIIGGVWASNSHVDPFNQIIGFDQFIKIDADAFAFADEYVGSKDTRTLGSITAVTGVAGSDGQVDHRDGYGLKNNQALSCKILYAARKNGQNWASDDQMRNATQESDDLVWYDSLDDVEGKVVGLLYQQRGPIGTGTLYPRIWFYATVRDDAQVDKTYMITHTMRLWNLKSLPRIENALGTSVESIPLKTTENAGYAQNDQMLKAYMGGLAFERSEKTYQYFKQEYYEDGTSSPAKPSGYSYGDTMYVAPYQTTADIGVANNVPGGADSSQFVFDLDAGQNVVDYSVEPKMEIGVKTTEAAGGTSQTDVTMTLTLDDGLTYIPGSVYWSGTYTPAAQHGRKGTVEGGLQLLDGQTTQYEFSFQNAAGTQFTAVIPISLTVSENENGKTTLKLVFENVPLQESDRAENALGKKLHFSAMLENLSGGNTDNLSAEVRIQGRHEHREITLKNGNMDVQDIMVQQLSSEAISSVTESRYVEIDALCSWNVTYSNNGNTARTDALLFSVLPDKADYIYDFARWELDLEKAGLTEQNADEITLYYTTGNVSGKDAGSYTMAELADDPAWKPLKLKVHTTADGRKLLVPENISVAKDATAWALTGLLPGASAYEVCHGIQPHGSEAGEVYQNVSSYRTSKGVALTTYASAYVIGRELSGLVWYDKDQDGQRSAGEALVSGVEVALYRKDAGGAYQQVINDRQGNPFGTAGVLTTGADGRYSFDRLDAGDYTVVFGGTALQNYSAETLHQAPSVAENVNSDVKSGSPTDTFGLYMTEPDIAFHSIEEINAGTVALKANKELKEQFDAGLIRNGSLTVRKIAENLPEGSNDSFDFTLSLKLDGADFTKDLSAGGSTLTAADGAYAFQLQPGQTVTIANIPDGAAYTVGEVARENYVTHSTGTKGSIAFGQTAAAEFTNTYVDEASLVLKGKKTLTGREFRSGDEFFFKLTPMDNAPMPSAAEISVSPTGGSECAFAFASIPYSLADVGKTYTYFVEEVLPNGKTSIPGIQYSTEKYTVTVDVALDESKKLVVNASDHAEALNFTNYYSAKGSVTFPVKKELSVPAGLTPDGIAGKFTFTLKTDAGAPMPETTQYINPDANGGTVTFGPIQYTKPGTYTYTVTESGSASGVTNDADATKTVTVTVRDNGDGTLTAAASSTASAPLTFTNTYAASGSATFPVKKELSVPAGLTPDSIAGKFTFTLKTDSGAPMPETTQYTNPDANGGTVTFGPIHYTKPGTYTYTVTESGSASGVTNDADATKTVTVTVRDNGDGTLTAAASSTESAPLTFTNTYAASGSVTFPVKKELSVPAGLTPDGIAGKFTFTLKTDAGAPMPETTQYTNPDANGGTVTFGPIQYTKPGTYTYTVTESGSASGVTNDADATKTVTVTVRDNGDGTLTAAASSTESAPLTFTNTYAASGSVTFPVKKELSVPAGLTPDGIAGKFTFTLKTDAGAPMPETTQYTNPDANGGTVTFGPIQYTEPGTYTYTVTESGSASGVTNDATATKTVTVTVRDNGSGQLVASPSSTASAPLTFTNTYSASGSVKFTGKKYITGRDYQPGDSFTFELKALNGAPLPKNEAGEEVSEVTINPESGSIAELDFGTLQLTQDDVGKTYTYAITEIQGPIEHVTYDTDVRVVTLTVLDTGNGVAKGVLSDELVWINVYRKPILTIVKVWDDDDYEFRPQEVTVVVTSRQDRNFRRICVLSEQNGWKTTLYDIPEDHIYIVKEISIDPAYYSQVKKNGNVFTITNRLRSKLPPTGDNSHPALWAMLMMLCAAALWYNVRKRSAGAWLIEKKR